MTNRDLLQSLASAFLARAKAQRWRGPTADDRAVEFFLGAWQSLTLTEHPAANAVGFFTTMVLPSRGVRELQKIAKEVKDEP